MDNIASQFKSAKASYDAGRSPVDALADLSAYCVRLLATKAAVAEFPSASRAKQYSLFRDGKKLSRPVLSPLFIADPDDFLREWKSTLKLARPADRKIAASKEAITRVLYTSIASFSICYDLWKPGSRKTPGTFFEVVLGSWLSTVLPGWERTKFVPLPGESESVSTDIVMTRPDKLLSLVFPAKITTRERIVQPFAHQRILDSVFGVGRYKSFLVCMSEMQRDEEDGANEICVPGTIRLFQKHLAQLSGIYYLDPPARYLYPDVTSVVKVDYLGGFFAEDLALLTV